MASDDVPTVAVYAALPDVCSACRALDGRRVPYAELDQDPELQTPNPHCMHDTCWCALLYLYGEAVKGTHDA